MLPFLLLWQVLALFLSAFCLLQGKTLALDQPAPALLWPIPKTVISSLQALMQTFNDVVAEVLNGAEFLNEIANMIDKDMQVGGDFVFEESVDIELSKLTGILLPLFQSERGQLGAFLFWIWLTGKPHQWKECPPNCFQLGLSTR
jgi:hypothetical protein